MLRKALFVLCLSLLSICCAERRSVDDNKLTVTIPPLKYIVESIVGDDFDIEVLLPAGASPETYEPTPLQMTSIENSVMIFATGLIAFEHNIMSKILNEHIDNKYIILNSGIDLTGDECSHVHDVYTDDVHLHGKDPHIWTSPKALEIMAANAFAAVEKLYPDSVKYKANFESLMLDLEVLDSTVSASLSASEADCFVVFHPAFTYYARDYGLIQIALEHDGKEPSAERLRQTVELLRNKNIKRVFYQREFPRKTVDVLAAEIGAQAVEVNILDEDPRASILRITELITER